MGFSWGALSTLISQAKFKPYLFLPYMHVLVLQSDLSRNLSKLSHSGAVRDRNPVTIKMFCCVLITVGVSYVSRSIADAIVGVSN